MKSISCVLSVGVRIPIPPAGTILSIFSAQNPSSPKAVSDCLENYHQIALGLNAFGNSGFASHLRFGRMISYGSESPVHSSPIRVPSTAEIRVNREKVSRREWLRRAGHLAAALPLGMTPLLGTSASQDPSTGSQNVTPPPKDPSSLFNGDPTKYRFTPDEDHLLDEVERACFQFFWEQANPSSGLVKDRSQTGGPDSRNVASMAATGSGLTALCIADHRGWQDQK